MSSKLFYFLTWESSEKAWISDKRFDRDWITQWMSFECSEVARSHSLSPNVTRIEFFSHRKQDSTKRSVRRKLAKNLITLALIGGGEKRPDPSRVSRKDDELITFITLGKIFL